MTDATHEQAGELMGLVREHLYIDGRAPDGYDDARDMSILRRWLQKGVSYDDMADMIRGGGKMRDDEALKWIEPGDGMTLRVFNPKVSRYGRHMAQTARDYWRAHERSKVKKLDMGLPSQDVLVSRLANALEQARGT